MPRALRIVIACDNCDEEIDTPDENHEGALTLSINGRGPKQLDLCANCLRGVGASPLNVWALIYALFEEADTIPDATPARRSRGSGANQSAPTPCPVCGHVAGSPQGLGRHCRTEHGASLAKLRQTHPPVADSFRVGNS